MRTRKLEPHNFFKIPLNLRVEKKNWSWGIPYGNTRLRTEPEFNILTYSIQNSNLPNWNDLTDHTVLPYHLVEDKPINDLVEVQLLLDGVLLEILVMDENRIYNVIIGSRY
jgi:hypothetical protein